MKIVRNSLKIVFLYLLFISISFSQWFNINCEGVNRSFYVSYPENDIDEPVPLIINMHGYGGSASQQQSYSQMDLYAHAENIAVVYPQGLNNSWNVFTYWDTNSYDDVGFTNDMIDFISLNFNIDSNRIYACGMSNGGYMAYRLACDLSDKITAFGSVTGNFMINNSIDDCQDQNREIPIIHFHGTADGVVNYYPPSFDGALTVSESIQFWRNFNNLDDELIVDINNYVEIYKYSSNSSLTEFVHYKIYGGGHEWFGSSWSVNWGFNTTQELINFFSQYQLSDFVISYLLGDLNDDEIINIMDIIEVVNIILNNDYFNVIADLNQDGENDILDIIAIVDIILS